jgi:glucose/arabinose dehydrogenase
MTRYYLFLLGFFYFYSVFAQPIIALEPFGIGFNKPVTIKHADDDRIFVVEQDGLIQILNVDATVNANPFLNIESIVGDIGGIGDERGLLGLAFHPDYTNNGFFYVNYINNNGNTVVSRFSVSNSNANLANPNSELILLTISQPFGNHNGGDLAFGSDGYLYISSGDGGSGGDPGNRAQNLNLLLGKMLRIDVDNTSNSNNYAIPSGNPFIGDPNTLDEIWAYGLRNPWKFSFDKQNGDMWIADVGQGSFEEINRVSSTSSGVNYGWRCYEGNNVFNNTGCPADNTLTFPVAEYSHSNNRCSITGGYRYRGSLYPGFSGWYFFADYCSNEIGVLKGNGNNWDIAYSEEFSGNGWAAFGEDVNGELYIAGVSSGTIYKIMDVGLSVDTFNSFDFSMYPNPTKDELKFDFKELSVPVTIDIYDIQGKLIHNVKDISNNLVNITVKNFAKGLYIVKVSDVNGNKANNKLIVN